MADVEFYINSLQVQQQQEIMWALHHRFVSYPQITAKVKFNVPFYYFKTWVCYLNKIKPHGIEVCFLRGYELQLHPKLLLAKNRKMVKGITIEKLTPALLRKVEEVFIFAITLADKKPFSVSDYKKHRQHHGM